ncbi:undecaprenyl/decaprenyl-phosphate alpha-N-acetylglucosaminyl 1-phosphate transferase [Patescibacteria group bacterium]|nr:undecaprenyl/decaprenyl-phosphate alpha-N-acetylglucosaminyl 1-phosphate transferase [Patescibacteria group bacterium]
MPLDLQILSTEHLIFFAVAFVLVYSLIGLVLKYWPAALTKALPRPQVRYAGGFLIVITVTLSLGAGLPLNLYLGLLLAGAITIIAGSRDEEQPASPIEQLAWQLSIILVVLLAGWTIRFVSNPLGEGIMYLDNQTFGPLVFPGSIITVVWLLVIINAMNWLDGVDGLAAGVGLVAFITLAAVSLLPSIRDYQTLRLSLIGAGAVLGFLLWNFPPAKVFLGTSGSWWLGLLLGLVALLGGGKIATTVLVLALPVLDLVSVIGQRVAQGIPPWQGDRRLHLHHRLTANGISGRTITLGAIAATGALGLAAVTLQTTHKLAAALVAIALIAVVFLGASLKTRSST